jgi:5-methylcytosine-specific restriction endonuclease McrA
VHIMRAYAKKFYNSTVWRRCRDGFLNIKLGICERCGKPAEVVHHKVFITPNNINDTAITLNYENLEALCHDCHNKLHNKVEIYYRYKFDSNGNLKQLPPPISNFEVITL